MVGIYKIQCKVDNKIYIGYSSDVKKRFSIHKYKLSKNKHENSYLQNAWNKHGKDNFSFILLEECLIELCINREDYYVKLHKANNRRYGYNLALTGIGSIGKMPKDIIEKSRQVRKDNAQKRGYYFSKETIQKQADGRRGFKHTKEAKEKIKIASTGRKRTKESIQKSVNAHILSVEQYSLENQYIRDFSSISEALKNLGKSLNSGHISSCCRGKRDKAYGYKWKYK
jgi:group I intron endonuclease